MLNGVDESMHMLAAGNELFLVEVLSYHVLFYGYRFLYDI
jgi:hypothetical protein